MNTDTGRIYDLASIYGDEQAAASRLDEMATYFTSQVIREVMTSDPPARYSTPGEELSAERERAEFEHAFVAGDAVAVSGRVAQQMKVGQRELKRRERRRVRDARKRQRGR